MKTKYWNLFFPHVIAVFIFLIVAIFFCKPVINGKVLQQTDVTLWKTMAQNSFEYQEKHGEFPLWTNGIFSGMPAFQITSVGSNPISVGYIADILTFNLPKPISFFFLACLCFYFLSQVLFINPYIGIFGALSYAYATYNPIIIAAGHETKMLAIAYMPAFIASILIIYNKRYLWGTTFTALFTCLIIAANHLQITYYSCIIAMIMSISFGITWIKQKDYKHLFASIGLVFFSAILGILVNIVTLSTTYDYSKRTIRGGSELAIETNSNDINRNGLGKNYAMSYSLFKTEPLVMIFPRIYGGSSHYLEVTEEKSKALEALRQMPQQLGQDLQSFLQFYWGGINETGTSGPPYLGSIVCFFALLGFVMLNGKHKWWILITCCFAISMSWGKYFEIFNSALLNILPFYNKFRAPSMILVIPTLLLSMMSILTLDHIIKSNNKELLFQKYKKGLLLVSGVFVLGFIVYFNSDFLGGSDKELIQIVDNIGDPNQKRNIEPLVKNFVSGLKEDRKDIFLSDIFRSFSFILIAFLTILLYIKRKIKASVTIAIVGVFAFIDVIIIDNKYLNDDNYVYKDESENKFIPTTLNQEINADTGYYRVFDLSQGIVAAFNGGPVSSYFHKSVGGYHPAKLSIYQDLINYQLLKFPNCQPVLNMLNAKYFIIPSKQNGNEMAVQKNSEALGPCWFVKNLEFKTTAVDVMKELSNFNPANTAILFETSKQEFLTNPLYDSSSFIKLIYNDNDIIEYKSFSEKKEFAVFSEIYYDDGWIAKIDGQESKIIRTNYVLRGLQIPPGNHTIVFEFRPSSFYKTNKIALIASILIWILLIISILNSLSKFYNSQEKS